VTPSYALFVSERTEQPKEDAMTRAVLLASAMLALFLIIAGAAAPADGGQTVTMLFGSF
jgi:hypothetical protein